MNASSLIPTPNDADRADEYFEPEDVALRRHLGFRSTVLRDDEPHPDARPCPSWCTYADSEYQHEVDSRRPFVAEHSLYPSPTVILSRYFGASMRTPGRVETASLDVQLRRSGDAPETIELHMRRPSKRDTDDYYQQVLRLSLTDAQELRAALGWVLEVADVG